jgi:hypothetical protein
MPVPVRVTLNEKLAPLSNVAITLRALVIDTLQAPLPVHAPLQPTNVEPLEAAAISVTEVPLAKLALQIGPQFMPAGDDVAVPSPVPTFVTVTLFSVLPLLRARATTGKNRFAIFTKPDVTGWTRSYESATTSKPVQTSARKMGD